MKVSENWLKKIVHIPFSSEKLQEKLTLAGIEVDQLEKIGNDTVLTLKIPANRGDCLSMEGIAREVSALSNIPYNPIEIKTILPHIKEVFPVETQVPAGAEVSIAGQTDAVCPIYFGRIIQNINTRIPTPTYIQERLERAGIRCISAVVDICNYVMLELGQPLHAFDFHRLQDGIVVRFAKKGESLLTLEDKLEKLVPDTLIIADSKGPLAIAGIIGGKDSSVTEQTQTIFLESAYFDPISIRHTSQVLGIRSESSIRFERGVAPNLQDRALQRATELIYEIMGGNVGPIVEKSLERCIPKKTPILLRFERVQQLLGFTIPPQEIQDILHRLDMQTSRTDGGLMVLAPLFRFDIEIEEDLIEELLRIKGLQELTAERPVLQLEPEKSSDNTRSAMRIKQQLQDRGYSEAINYSFIPLDALGLSETAIDKSNLDTSKDKSNLIITNPISNEMALMRSSLLYGLIQNVLFNQHRNMTRVRLFEMGACFAAQGDADLGDKAGRLKTEKTFAIQEIEKIAGIASGTAFPEQWGIKARDLDFFDVKADVESLLVDKENITWKISSNPLLHPGQSADIFKEGKKIGMVGALHPSMIKKYELQGPVFVFECDKDAISKAPAVHFEEVSKFPSIRRDLALIVPYSVTVESILLEIQKLAEPLLKKLVVFDVYSGKGIPEGAKSLGIGIILQHPDRTLVEAEINDLMHNIMDTLKLQLKAVVRE